MKLTGSYLNSRSTLADQERVLFIDDTDGDSILSKRQGADETDGTSTDLNIAKGTLDARSLCRDNYELWRILTTSTSTGEDMV